MHNIEYRQTVNHLNTSYKSRMNDNHSTLQISKLVVSPRRRRSHSGAGANWWCLLDAEVATVVQVHTPKDQNIKQICPV